MFLKFILYTILFYILFRLITTMIRNFSKKNDNEIKSQPKTKKSRYEDIEEAKYIEVKQEDEKKNWCEMSFSSLPIKITNSILKQFFALQENQFSQIIEVKKTLLVCSHFNLGDLISSTSLYRAIKEKFPKSDLIVVVNDESLTQINNHLIDEFIVIERKKLLNPIYFFSILQKVKQEFDLVIVPNIGDNSMLADYIARLSNSKIRIGTKSLNGKNNQTEFCFDIKIDLNISKHPDANISERVLEIIRPLGFDTNDLSTTIFKSDTDLKKAKARLSEIKKNQQTLLIGINVYSEEIANNWNLNNFVVLIERLNREYQSAFYLFGNDNNESIKFLRKNTKVGFLSIDIKNYSEIASIISLTDIFITVDSSLMHIAGTTTTPQISLFGNTNPFNFAPCGKNKIFLRKSDLIDDISADDVFEVCKVLINNESKTIWAEH